MVYGGDFNGKRKTIINRHGQQQFLSWALCHLVTQVGSDIFAASKGLVIPLTFETYSSFGGLVETGVLNKVGMQHAVCRTVFLQTLI